MDKKENQNTMTKAGCGFTVFAAVFILLCSINPFVTIGIFWFLAILVLCNLLIH